MPLQTQEQETLNVKLVHFTKQNSPDEPVQLAFSVTDEQGKEEIITAEGVLSDEDAERLAISVLMRSSYAFVTFNLVCSLTHLREWVYPAGHKTLKGVPRASMSREQGLAARELYTATHTLAIAPRAG